MSANHSTTTLPARLTAPRCLQCGLRAADPAASRMERCPRCGCDFLERPPRSYAEMEGLEEADAVNEEREAAAAALRARYDAAAARWVLLLGAVAVASAALIALAMVLDR